MAPRRYLLISLSMVPHLDFFIPLKSSLTLDVLKYIVWVHLCIFIFPTMINKMADPMMMSHVWIILIQYPVQLRKVCHCWLYVSGTQYHVELMNRFRPN